PGGGVVQPGDTILLRGGKYKGKFASQLVGTASQPIIVRGDPDDGPYAAKLDGGGGTAPALTINGQYTTFWGIEVFSSSLDRDSDSPGPWPPDLDRGDGIDSGSPYSDGIKIVNCLVHDNRQGISAFSAWSNTEITGNIIYFNGWQGTDN